MKLWIKRFCRPCKAGTTKLCAICRAVRGRGHVEPVFVARVEELADALRVLLRPGDVVLAMGAGNISAVAHELPARLSSGAQP